MLYAFSGKELYFFYAFVFCRHKGNKIDRNRCVRAPTKFRLHSTKFLHFAQLSLYFYSRTNNQSTPHVCL